MLVQVLTKVLTMSAPSFFSFSNLAKISTGRTPVLKGLLPPIGTTMALLATALIISGGWWLMAGASASAALFLPFYAKTVAIVCGMTLLNFIFQRDIQHAMHSCRPIEDEFEYDSENPTKPIKLVADLVEQLNHYFRQKYGDKHVDMPVPRLATFKHAHFEMETVLGMSPWHSEIMFSDGVFNFHHTQMNQRMLAAQIAKELAKIYMRRGSSHIIVRMGTDMLNTLESLQSANSFFKVLGVLTWPLQFLFLAERSLKRSYEYEASKVVVELGRGTDLYRYLDKDPCPTLTKKPDLATITQNRDNIKRPSYNGPLKFLLAPMHKWIVDNLELPSDHHGHNIIFVAVSGLIREGIFHVNELYSSSPRGTRLKEFILSELQKRDGVKANLDEHDAGDIVVNDIFKADASKCYKPIALDGNGFSKHDGHGHHHHGCSDESSREQALSLSGDNVVAFRQKDSAGESEKQSEIDEVGNKSKQRQGKNR